ncbi:NAD-dependent epimerase/dehydratase family protein [Lysobacter fragariae]
MASPSEQSRPRVLITGHDGFTGRYVAREMEAAGYRVIGLSHSAAATNDVICADLLDRDALRAAVAQARADVVIHLAAIAFVAHGDVEALYRVNVMGTRNLLEALVQAEHRPRAVVLASSANIYGNATVEPITEDTLAAPANDYAVSKLAMEHMARLWMDRLPIILTRPFNYTGVGQAAQFLIPKIVQHFRRGEREIELGNIRVWRDFSDVRDVARAYAALATTAPAGQVFNICSGNPHSLEEVLEAMAQIAGYRIEVRVNPALVRANEVIRLAGSSERLSAATGQAPSIPLRTTLEWMYSAHEGAAVSA